MNIEQFCEKFSVLKQMKDEITAIKEQNARLTEQLAMLNETITKAGYKVESVEGSTGTFQLVKDESTNDADGTPFKPYTYNEGDSVEQGKWYRTDTYIWECIKSGTPESILDSEYFDIIES